MGVVRRGAPDVAFGFSLAACAARVPTVADTTRCQRQCAAFAPSTRADDGTFSRFAKIEFDEPRDYCPGTLDARLLRSIGPDRERPQIEPLRSEESFESTRRE